MLEKKLIKAIHEHCMMAGEKKQLNCRKAFEIAGKMNVDISEIGAICDRESIKIASCQLGCFGTTK